MAQLHVPGLGEGVANATISFWFFQEGQRVKKDDSVVELTTDKAAVNVPSPCDGVIEKILKPEGEIVKVGEELAIIKES